MLSVTLGRVSGLVVRRDVSRPRVSGFENVPLQFLGDYYFDKNKALGSLGLIKWTTSKKFGL